jgi:hypothetical protein
MYSKLGVLSIKTTISKIDELTVNKKETFPFKKVTRSDLIAGYVGQTAIKTRDVIKECLAGVSSSTRPILWVHHVIMMGFRRSVSIHCVRP